MLNTPHRFAIPTIALSLFCSALLSVSTGCATEPPLPRDVAHDGYLYWFPAGTTIGPGDVCLYDSAVRGKFAARPSSLNVSAPQPVTVDVLTLPTSLRTQLDPETTRRSIAKAGPFSAELFAGTASGGEISYGPTSVVSISTAELQSIVDNPQGDTGYARAVQLVREGKPGVILIASVLVVPEVVMTITCKDPNLLVSRLPQLRALTDATIDAKVLDIHRLELTLRPPAGGGGLVVGVQPVRGQEIRLPVEQSRQQLANAGLNATSQQFAFRSGLAVLKGNVELVSASDSADAVDAKYAAAVNGSASATAPSTMPGTWRGSASTASSSEETPKPASAIEKASDSPPKPSTEPATQPTLGASSATTLPSDSGK